MNVPATAEAMVRARWPVSLLFAAAVVGAWQLAGALGQLPDYVLTPTEIVSAVVDLARSGDLGDLLAPSLRRSFTGFALGATLGVLLGLLTGVLLPAGDVLELPVAFTYPLPKVALFPAFAVWLGFDDSTRILVIALAVFYPCYLNAQSGTRAIDRNLIWVARNTGARRIRTFFQVVFPAALPRTLAGLRIGLALSFVLLFATEIIGFSDGIGAAAYNAYQDGAYEEMYAAIAVLAACGFLANAVLVGITTRLTHGQRVGTAEAIGR